MSRSLLSFLWKSRHASRVVRGPRPQRVGYRSTSQARRFRPQLEVLEDRQLLSTFTVVLPTDNGGPTGHKVSATTGDLRYCVEQANAAHSATTDTIGFSATLSATPITITLNSANGPLVLSDSHPLTIKGPTAGTINVSGGSKVEVFDIASGTVTINNLAIIYGNAGSGNGGGINNQGSLTLSNCFLDHDSVDLTIGHGGGIDNAGTLTLTKCTIYLDSGAVGGGIFNLGTATLTNCNLSNDKGVVGGGGVANIGTATLTNCTLSNDSTRTAGGGILSQVGTTTLTNCTLSNDSAVNAGGGGMYNQAGTATLTDCTLANDTAGDGGGIYNDASLGTTILTLTNCTLSINSASTASGGGIWNNNGGTLNLTNTIVAGNIAAIAGPDIFGVVTAADHNLVGDATGSSGITNAVGGNIVGGNGNSVIDARLGPLQNNGGPTETMALLPDSPAIGQADNTAAPAKDQRGLTRIDEAGEMTDIGAFEL